MKPIRITKNDVFKTLDYRVNRSVKNLSPEHLDSSLFFNESIHVLKNIENFIDKVVNRTISSLHTYEEAIKKNDQDRLKMVYESFSALRFHRKMFELPNVKYSDNFNIFKKIYINSEVIQRLSARLRISEIMDPDELYQLNKSFFQVEGCIVPSDYQWNQDSFPKEKCFEGVRKIREVVELEFDELIEKNLKQVENLDLVYQSFDQLLSVLGSVYVLCIDIRFINPHQMRNVNNFETFVHQIYQQVNLINSIFLNLPNFVQLNAKFEHDFNLGVNLSCILMLKHTPKFNEQELVESLQYQFNFLFSQGFHVQVSNWNEVVRKNFSNKAVGHIGKANTGKIDQFKYWILSYFYLIDHYIKLEFSLGENEQPCEINYALHAQNLLAPQIVDVTIGNSKPALQFQQLVTQADEKKIWTTRHLPEHLKIRISMAELYYNEQFFSNQELKQYLLDFEIMAAMLQQNSEQPFLIPILPADQTLNEKELRGCLTLTGKRLISLLKRGILVSKLSLDDLKHNIGLNAVLMFKNLHFSATALVLHEVLNLNSAKTLNNLASFLYAFQQKKMNNIFVLSGNKADFENYFEKNLDELNLYLDYKQKVCDKRLKSSQSYVKRLLIDDVYLLHIKLICKLNTGVLSQERFSKAFTNFLRLGKRTEPLKGLIGYIGLWKNDAQENPYVDMYLFFEKSCGGQTTHIGQQLSKSWSKFITEKSTTFLGVSNLAVKQASIELLPIYRSRPEYAESILLIQAKDKNAHKFILETLTKFIVYGDFFQVDSQKDVPKVFIKGAKTKNENSNVPKN